MDFLQIQKYRYIKIIQLEKNVHLITERLQRFRTQNLNFQMRKNDEGNLTVFPRPRLRSETSY